MNNQYVQYSARLLITQGGITNKPEEICQP